LCPGRFGVAGFFVRSGLPLAVAVAVLRPVSSHAGEDIETIVVIREKPSAPERIAPSSFATVIDASEHAAELETVTDALAESVGIQVRRYGGLGAFSTVSIRGSGSNQVQIYLDGIPLARAQNETVNLADLPIDSIDDIEVYRSTVPVTFGVAGLGGVVNLVTKPPTSEPTAELSAAYGSFETRKIVGSYSQEIHGIGLLAHATYLGSKGDFDFTQDPTPGLPNDANVSATRVNNEFDSVNALLKASYSVDARTQIDATSEAFYKNQGVPGLGLPQLRHPSFEEWRSLNYLRLNREDFVAENLDASAALFGTYQVQRFVDKKNETGLGRQDRDDTTVNVGVNATATYAVSPAHEGALFSELSHETFSPRNEVQTRPDGPEQKRLRWTLAFQDSVTLLPDLILLVPSVRYEHLDDDVTGSFTPAGMPLGRDTVARDLWGAAIGMRVLPSSWLTLKGNIGRYQRAPSFSELFGNSAGVIGNPKLDPETALNRDIGFILQPDMLPAWVDVLLEYAYFDNDVDDLITLVYSTFPFARAQNIGAARIRGHEVVLSSHLLDFVSFDLNYTHQDAEDRGKDALKQGKQLPFRPQDELYTRIELDHDLGEIYYEFNFIGSNSLTRAALFDRDRVGERSIHTAGVAFNATAWLTFRFEGRNLSDNHIKDVANYPLPGRSFFGSATAQF